MNTTMPDFDALLTTDELLTRLKITSRRMYRLIRSGELPAVRIGRQWRFRPEDVHNWLEQQRMPYPSGTHEAASSGASPR